MQFAIATGCQLSWMMTKVSLAHETTHMSIFLKTQTDTLDSSFFLLRMDCPHVNVHWCRNTLSFVKWIKRQIKINKSSQLLVRVYWMPFYSKSYVNYMCERSGMCWRAMHICFACVKEIIYASTSECETIKFAHLNIISLLFVFYFSFCRARWMHNNEYE